MINTIYNTKYQTKYNDLQLVNFQKKTNNKKPSFGALASDNELKENFKDNNHRLAWAYLSDACTRLEYGYGTAREEEKALSRTLLPGVRALMQQAVKEIMPEPAFEYNKTVVDHYKNINNELGDAVVKRLGGEPCAAPKCAPKPVNDPKDLPPFDPEKLMPEVAGMKDLKERLYNEVYAPIVYPDKRCDKKPNAILLYGPPGCGKTYVAQSMAKALGMAYMEINMAKVGDKYIHNTSKKLGQAFKEAEDKSPALLFIDEFDSLAVNRSNIGESSHSKLEEVNTLLDQIQNVADRDILLVAATNKKHLIDGAIIRSGRFSNYYEVGIPDKETRKAILKAGLLERPAGEQLAKDEEFLEKTSEKLEGCSNADIASGIGKSFGAGVVHLAFSEYRKDPDRGDFITREHFEKAMNSKAFKDIKKMTAKSLEEYDMENNNTTQKLPSGEWGFQPPSKA